ELLIERARGRGLVGNIYMGRVARVLPGMQSAFIEIGLERAAFLHVADIWENKEPGRPIEKILAEGSPLLVQVVKDPIGSKVARAARAARHGGCRDAARAGRLAREPPEAGRLRAALHAAGREPHRALWR